MKIQSIVILATAPFIAAHPTRIRKGAATRHSTTTIRRLQTKQAPAPDAEEPVKADTPDDVPMKVVDNGPVVDPPVKDVDSTVAVDPPEKEVEDQKPLKEDDMSMPGLTEPVEEESDEENEQTETSKDSEEEEEASVEGEMSIPEQLPVDTIPVTKITAETTMEMSMPEWDMSVVAQGVDDEPIVIQEEVDDQLLIDEIVDDTSSSVKADDTFQFADAVVEEEVVGSGSVVLTSSFAGVAIAAAAIIIV